MNKEELLMLLMLYGISAEKLGDVLVVEILKQIESGVPIITAIDNALAQTGFIKGYSENLIDTICIAAYLGYGFSSTSIASSSSVMSSTTPRSTTTTASTSSVSTTTYSTSTSSSSVMSSNNNQLSTGNNIELAPTIPQIKTAKQLAMEQGLVPTIIIGDGIKNKVLSESWTADKMNLSTRLHGTEPKMRQAIIDTLSAGMRQGKTVKDMAMDLYDGYNSGKQVIGSAELPDYLKKLTAAARSAAGGDLSITREFNKAVEKASASIAKLGNKEMKAAYKQVLDAAKDLNVKAMEKAAWVAVQEKSRYHADRIATTEMARAWSDGFFAKHANDSRVIGYKWQLSSNHPRFDICDFHATADLYGMGAGVYPKDKVPPHPAHPYCHCNLQPVYKGEATPGEFNADAGKEWLQKQSRYNRQQLLGIEGNKAFENGEDWRKYLRSWNGHKNPMPRFSMKDLKLPNSYNHAKMESNMINIAEQVRKQVIANGPVWKDGSLERHLKKRKGRRHIPQDWTTSDYNNQIIKILSDSTEVYLYHQANFPQRYFVYCLPAWIVIIGEDGVMETAFIRDEGDFDSYFDGNNGYTKLYDRRKGDKNVE